RGQKGAARAAGVDEPDVLRGQLVEQLRPLGDGQIRTGQVERRLLTVKLPCPISSTTTESLGLTRAATSANAFSTPSFVARRSASTVMFASGTLSFFFAASTNVSAHFWNCFASSSSPATPLIPTRHPSHPT